MSDADLLVANLPVALTSGVEVQASLQTIKAVVSRAVSELRPAGIDLFLVGPAALAVALGHRWNALPETQVYEFQQKRSPVCTHCHHQLSQHHVMPAIPVLIEAPPLPTDDRSSRRFHFDMPESS